MGHPLVKGRSTNGVVAVNEPVTGSMDRFLRIEVQVFTGVTKEFDEYRGTLNTKEKASESNPSTESNKPLHKIWTSSSETLREHQKYIKIQHFVYFITS